MKKEAHGHREMHFLCTNDDDGRWTLIESIYGKLLALERDDVLESLL